MVRQSGKLESAARRSFERSQRLAVQRKLPVRSNRFLDGDSGKLVAKPDAAWNGDEHPRRQAFLETVESLARDRLEQPQFRLRRRDRDGLDQGPPRRAQAPCS